jgi:hypothetical protein
MTNQLTLKATVCVIPLIFLKETTKDVPPVSDVTEALNAEFVNVTNTREFAVTDVVETVVSTTDPASTPEALNVNFPTEELPAAIPVAGFPTSTFAGRREP